MRKFITEPFASEACAVRFVRKWASPSTQPAAVEHPPGKPKDEPAKGLHNAYHPFHSFAVVRVRNAGHLGGIVRANRCIHFSWSARAAGVRAAARPRPRLSLDAWLLG